MNIPRIKFIVSESELPFTLQRIQFPVRLAFCMTINKAQGQTLDKTGLYRQQAAFSHGQLYVALTRSRAMEDLKVFTGTETGKAKKRLQRTVVNKIHTKQIVSDILLDVRLP